MHESQRTKNCSTPSGLAGFGNNLCSPWVSPTATQIKPLWGFNYNIYNNVIALFKGGRWYFRQ